MADVIPITPQHRTIAVLKLAKAVGDAIRELGSVPSGELYARVMGHMDINRYEQIIGLLKQADLVTESNAGLLTWKEPRT